MLGGMTEFLRVADIAADASVHPATVWRWINRSVDPLPTLRIDHTVRISRAEWAAWAARQS